MFASYKENGQTKRWSGSPEEFAKAIPANAEDLRGSFNQSRMEVFVTSGKPTRDDLRFAAHRPELERAVRVFAAAAATERERDGSRRRRQPRAATCAGAGLPLVHGVAPMLGPGDRP